MTNHWKTGNYHARIDGGESAQDLANRIQTFVQHLRNRPEKEILICSHGRAMRCLMCVLKDMPLHQMDHFKHANTGLYKAIYDGAAFHFELENSLSHLEFTTSV
jgi:probable phosphoglycerate mutase